MQLLSAKDVARRLAVSRSYIYTLIREHGFPNPMRVGNKLTWDDAEVTAWIASRAEARNA